MTLGTRHRESRVAQHLHNSVTRLGVYEPFSVHLIFSVFILFYLLAHTDMSILFTK